MGHIYREYNSIPIPEFAHIDRSDNRVYVMGVRPDNRKENPKRRVIGIIASENMMYPNDIFKHDFPELWKKYYNEDVGAE